jgi:hypothetical protein
MIRNAISRSLEVVILALAAYAFFYMPLGRRTPWGHVAAIFSTRPAKDAAEDVATTGRQLRDKVFPADAGNR